MFQPAAPFLDPVAFSLRLRHISEALNQSSVESRKFVALLFRGQGFSP